MEKSYRVIVECYDKNSPKKVVSQCWLFRVSSALELNASKGYHANMINNRRVHYGRITYPFRHSKPGNNIASH